MKGGSSHESSILGIGKQMKSRVHMEALTAGGEDVFLVSFMSW